MSKIYNALRDAQKSTGRDTEANNLVRSAPDEHRVLKCRSTDGNVAVRIVEKGLPLPKQSAAAGILLGKNDRGPECTLTVECHARIPGAQKENPFGDLFHLNTFVDRWNLNSSRYLEIVGLYRLADEGEDALTHQDLVALKAVDRQAPLVFLLIQAASSHCNLQLFVMRQGAIVASWTLPSTEETSLLNAGDKPLPLLDKPKLYLPPASSQISRVEQQPLHATWRYSIAVIALAALGIVGLFSAKSTRSLSASVNNPTLGLRLAREGSDWRLSWDADSQAVRDATTARLMIVDGNLEKNLDLDNADLRGGALLYTAATNDLVFKLQIATSDARKPIIQSVRAIDNLVAVPETSSALFTPEREITVRPANSATSNLPQSTPKLFAKTSTPNLSRPNTSKLRASNPSLSVIAPPDLPAATMEASSHSDPLGSLLSGPRFGTPFSPEQHDQSQFEPAQLAVRREPILPPGANGLEGVVKLQFLITDKGVVRDVKIIKGNPILGAAARAAVGMWRYKPATENGRPIQTEGAAVITFDQHSQR